MTTLPRFTRLLHCLSAVQIAFALHATAHAASPKIDVSPVSITNKTSALPEGWQRGAFMQIFMRSYRDSNGDGVGDLRGLIGQLDYLQELGIKGLWLMPINHSQDGDHGYAVQDFRAIEPAYGNLADFDTLIKEAHKRGIGVIMDYVINHSAAKNPLFIDAASGPKSRFRHWYTWQSSQPQDWKIWDNNPWRKTDQGAYYAVFWDQMPDMNLRNPAVVKYHQDNLRFWLNRGLDGFRFDAVGCLFENGPHAWENQPENYPFMGTMRHVVDQYQRRFVVCEGPDHDHMGYAAKSSCGSAFAFGHHKNIIDAARGKSDAIKAVADYFTRSPTTMATMLSNHDTHGGQRLWDQLGGNIEQYKLAAATYLLGPGTPFIYYGEEVGMAGASKLVHDAILRTPMSWTADSKTGGFSSAKPYRDLSANVLTQNVEAQLNDSNSLRNFYKQLLQIRNSFPSIARGSYESPFVQGSVFGYQRKFQHENTLVLINYSTQTETVDVKNLPIKRSLKKVFPVGTAAITLDAVGLPAITMAAQSVMVLRVE
jgi:alpha-amylase